MELEQGPRSLHMAMGFIPQLPTEQGHCLHLLGPLPSLIIARSCSLLYSGFHHIPGPAW